MSLVTPSHESRSMNGVLELLADPDQLEQRIKSFQSAEETASNQLSAARAEAEDIKAAFAAASA